MDIPAGSKILIDATVWPGTFDWYLDSVTIVQQPTPPVEVSQNLQVGQDNEACHRVQVDYADARASTLAIDTLDITTTAGANSAIDAIDSALDSISNGRADAGIIQRRLGNIQNDLSAQKINVSAANSRIEDADMAVEYSEMVKAQIIQQATLSVGAKANFEATSVMQLIEQNVR